MANASVAGPWDLTIPGAYNQPTVFAGSSTMFPAGAILGERFRIVRTVGSGGMGTVYEATDLKLDRRVALKCARPGYHYRLPPEASAAREVSHFNVCKVHELHTLTTPDGELDCLSMEFIEGETLSHRIREKPPLTRQEAREVATQICVGLAQAHRQGVVHGDLKCGNVILTRSPEGRMRAVITDFGLARITGVASEESKTAGTYDYMAPEQLLGERATIASDLYAIGVLFHVMLTGNAPRRLRSLRQTPEPWTPDSGGTTRTIARGLIEADWQREIEPLPAPWKKMIAGCMAASPEKRPSSVAGLMNALEPRRRLVKILAAVAGAVALVVAGREFRSQIPVTPVRLAVLPFTFEGDGSANAAGIGIEVAERLAGARRKFTVISPREAGRNQAVTPEKARVMLGATHVLDTHLRSTAGRMEATASLVDLQSGRTIRQLQGVYAAGDEPVLAKALIATVTEAFDLPAPKEAVSAPAYAYYAQGIDLLRRDDAANADQAIPLFNRAIELDPTSALPYAGLAESQVQKFDRGDGAQWLEAAARSVAKAASINPDSVPVLLASGFVQQQNGQYERAIHLLTRAADIAPDDAETWRRLAFCYERANRPDEAVGTYKKAVATQPDYYRHHLSFGTFYFNRGQFGRAEEEYRKVVGIAPGLASGHMNLGLALMQEGHFPEAETQLLEALGLRRSLNLLINVAGLYYEEERFEDAASYYALSLRAGDPSAMQYRGLGDANRHLGHVQSARSAYQLARQLATLDVTRNPQRAAAHSLLGLVDAFLRDQERAGFELSQALTIDPENRSVMRDAAIAYDFLGRRDEALAALRNAPRPLLEELSRQPDVKGLRSDSRFQMLLSKAPVQ